MPGTETAQLKPHLRIHPHPTPSPPIAERTFGSVPESLRAWPGTSHKEGRKGIGAELYRVAKSSPGKNYKLVKDLEFHVLLIYAENTTVPNKCTLICSRN